MEAWLKSVDRYADRQMLTNMIWGHNKNESHPKLFQALKMIRFAGISSNSMHLYFFK